MARDANGMIHFERIAVLAAYEWLNAYIPSVSRRFEISFDVEAIFVALWYFFLLLYILPYLLFYTHLPETHTPNDVIMVSSNQMW